MNQRQKNKFHKAIKSLTELLPSQRDLYRRVKIEQWKRMPKLEQEQVIKMAKEKYNIENPEERISNKKVQNKNMPERST